MARKLTPTVFALIALAALPALSACGKGTTNSPTLTVNCAETQTCKALLTWDYADAERGEITGFKLYYGGISRTDPAFVAYDHIIEIGPNEKEVNVPNLGATAHVYFTMTAYATTVTARCASPSCESVYSNEVSLDFSQLPAGSVLTMKMGG